MRCVSSKIFLNKFALRFSFVCLPVISIHSSKSADSIDMSTSGKLIQLLTSCFLLGAVRKLWTKLSPVAIIEQTQMRAEFLKAVEEYDAYKEVVEDLVDKLESFVKTSPLVGEVT